MYLANVHRLFPCPIVTLHRGSGVAPHPERISRWGACDAQALLTDKLGFMADDVRVLTDDADAATPPPTAAQLRKALRWLTAGAAPGDHLAFYFAGLATLVPDVDGDGAGGRDQCLCPVDMLTVSQDKCISVRIPSLLFISVCEQLWPVTEAGQL